MNTKFQEALLRFRKNLGVKERKPKTQEEIEAEALQAIQGDIERVNGDIERAMKRMKDLQ